MLKYWQLVEWAADSADEVDDLVDEIQSIVPIPSGFQPILPTVESTFPLQARLASLWDRFPANTLMALPPEAEQKRQSVAEGRLKAIGDGKLLEKIQKVWPIIQAAWQFYQMFKPV